MPGGPQPPGKRAAAAVAMCSLGQRRPWRPQASRRLLMPAHVPLHLQVRRSATPSAKPEPAAQPPAAVAGNGAGSAATPPSAEAAKSAPPAPAPTSPAEAAKQPSSDLAELKRVLATAVAAQEQYSQYSQEQVGAVHGGGWPDLVQMLHGARAGKGCMSCCMSGGMAAVWPPVVNVPAPCCPCGPCTQCHAWGCMHEAAGQQWHPRLLSRPCVMPHAASLMACFVLFT